MSTVIRVENLGKKYIIRHLQQGNYQTLREVINDKARNLGKRVLLPLDKESEAASAKEEFWALKDVSFEVKQGDRLGIIGRNGAGKSTLLKILSRIAEPSTGRVTLKGRVASLLEVGTGFHPELTGRENIFLNGAILGMSKAEIKKKFDEIVTFAEVEKFLDTPVKRYSSGMYVRLAFSVAAHLEPEIFVVDEVLAVGDIQFQNKCLGKMEDIGQEGRTVLFVSHNMAAIESLCEIGIVFSRGELTYSGRVKNAIEYYLKTNHEKSERGLSENKNRNGRGSVRITSIDIEDSQGNKNTPFLIGSELKFSLNYVALNEFSNPRIIIGVYDLMNVSVTRFDTNITGGIYTNLPIEGKITCSTERINLAPGLYNVNIALFSNDILDDYIPTAITIEICNSDYFNTGRVFEREETMILFRHKWEIEYK